LRSLCTVTSRETLELVRSYYGIEDMNVRKRLTNMIRAIASESNGTVLRVVSWLQVDLIARVAQLAGSLQRSPFDEILKVAGRGRT